tara:strand:+ start:265 stop:981 length:717 start_codon:yes stop_codon:yes gene_type:complete
MVIYGINPVLDSIKISPDNIVKIYVSKKTIKKIPAILLKKIKNIKLNYLSDYEFERLTNSSNHQSLAAEISVKSIKGVSELKRNKDKIEKIVILDHLKDPQNLGAIARTCVFFGITDIIIPSDRSASISPGSVKSSAGSIFSINFYQVPNLPNILEYLKNNHYWILGADLDGIDYQDNCFDKFLSEKIVIVMGSEEKGMSPLVKKKCDLLIRINNKGLTNSLNVSVAAGILISRFDID